MANEMGRRFLTAAAFLPVGIFVLFFKIGSGIPLFIVLWIFQIILLTEIAGMVEKRGYKFNLWSTSVLVTLSTLNFYLYGAGVFTSAVFLGAELGLVTVYTGATFFLGSIHSRSEKTFEEIGFSLFSFVMAGLFLSTVGLLKMEDLSGWLVGMVILIAWLTDAGGLLFGIWLGKTKLSFLSSPNKTLEGYIGAIFTAVLVSVIFYFLQNNLPVTTNFSFLQFLIIGFVTGLAGLIGDLAESTIKRWAGVKDSGSIMPGHGGVYDVFDSVILAAPSFYVLIKIFGI